MENPVPKFKKGDEVFVTCWWSEPGTREQVYEGTCFQLEKINGRGEWVGVNRKTWREVTVPKPPENHIRLAPPKMK